MQEPNLGTLAPRKHGGDLGFWALIVTQFQGAFNDNAYKWILFFHLSRRYADPVTGEASETVAFRLLAVSLVMFAVPYLAFPGLAGALADRFSKRQITIWTKWWEVGVMTFGLVAFALDNIVLMGALLLLMFTQSAFFSPAKYGILPEMLPESRLSWGNGILQMATFVAIILGTGAVGPLFDLNVSIYIMSLLLIGLSVLGLCTSYAVTRVPAAAPTRSIPVNPWSGMGGYFRHYWSDRALFLAMIGGGFFWFLGPLLQNNVTVLGEATLGLMKTQVSILSLSIALGIGIGSVAAGYLSRRKIELGLVPLGIAGMTVAALLLSAPSGSFVAITAMLFLLGSSSGFFEVPLVATVQHRSPRETRGGMVAAYNIVTCLGICIAGLVFAGLGPDGLGLGPYGIFAVAALLTAGIGVYLCVSLPLFVLRTALWVMGNSLFNVKTLGRENIPVSGGVLLAANHSSFFDVLILAASIDRPVRFLLSADILQRAWIRPFVWFLRPLLVASDAGPDALEKALKAASDALKSGEVVCVFSETQFARTGVKLPFRRSFERVTKGTGAPIVPVYMDRLWGNAFRLADGRYIMRLPRRLPCPVIVAYGAPMPSDTSAVEVRRSIQRIGMDAAFQRKPHCSLLHRGFVRMARRNPLLTSMADMNTPRVPYWKALVGSIALARKFRALLDDRPMVGVLLPPTVGGALTNIALQLMGKTVVNLNYTASDEAVESAARQCDIKHVITAHAFLEKVSVKVPGEPIYLEQVRKSMTGGDRLLAMLWAAFMPVRLLERRLGGSRRRSPDDLATVIFSSGSEGEPKGVMLSHYNIASNIEGGLQVFVREKGDVMMAILPFFHSFGFMATLWLPLVDGFTVVFYPNPLEAKAIGQLMFKYKAKFLVAAPTFLQAFIRRCLPEELASLHYVVTGAEKLPARVREAFHAKFGIEPLEGYGTTECAPGVSFNIPDFSAPGFFRIGTKHGTVGYPLPGIGARIIDPDTGDELPVGEPGLLHIKGPNIMRGYLGQPERTAKVLRDGWYNTGDIAMLDEYGFITITDRLSRFSKIAGEMVPHTKVEEVLHSLLGLTEQQMVVTGIPDENKGEKLVVLHTLNNGELEELVGKMSESGLPRLWLPKYNSFYHIGDIPVLGTGKVDIKRVKELARELDIGE